MKQTAESVSTDGQSSTSKSLKSESLKLVGKLLQPQKTAKSQSFYRIGPKSPRCKTTEVKSDSKEPAVFIFDNELTSCKSATTVTRTLMADNVHRSSDSGEQPLPTMNSTENLAVKIDCCRADSNENQQRIYVVSNNSADNILSSDVGAKPPVSRLPPRYNGCHRSSMPILQPEDYNKLLNGYRNPHVNGDLVASQSSTSSKYPVLL